MHSRDQLILEFGHLSAALFDRVKALEARGTSPKLIAKFEAWGEKLINDIIKLQRSYFYVLDKMDAVAGEPPPSARHSHVRSLRPGRRR